tara:strand:+ start:529 stop:1071 length:543 start_codon:yes stop_codon:yes gene_type:complete
MKIKKTKFEGLFVVKQSLNIDKRGYLRETHNDKIIKKKFNFEYFTFSKANVLRGFHFQVKQPQSKYVNVLKGKILDCVVDLRLKSKTFGKTFKIVLSEKNSLGLFIPRGFAHAYYSLGNENLIYYKLDNYYKPKFEHGIIWNDKMLNINWPSKKPHISSKDKKMPELKYYLKNKKLLNFK